MTLNDIPLLGDASGLITVVFLVISFIVWLVNQLMEKGGGAKAQQRPQARPAQPPGQEDAIEAFLRRTATARGEAPRRLCPPGRPRGALRRPSRRHVRLAAPTRTSRTNSFWRTRRIPMKAWRTMSTTIWSRAALKIGRPISIRSMSNSIATSTPCSTTRWARSPSPRLENSRLFRRSF